MLACLLGRGRINPTKVPERFNEIRNFDEIILRGLVFFMANTNIFLKTKHTHHWWYTAMYPSNL